MLNSNRVIRGVSPIMCIWSDPPPFRLSRRDGPLGVAIESFAKSELSAHLGYEKGGRRAISANVNMYI